MILGRRPALAACLALATAHLARGADPAPARDEPYGIVAQKGVMVPMRDGVRLATDIYLPARNGAPAAERFPVVFSRTPYGRGGARGDAQTYVSSGYVVVGQDTRGRGDSEGVWHWMSDDGRDGCDAIEWIARQPWANGRIGMTGCSYVGATQHLAALERPPHLTTIVPADPSINHGRGGILYGGAFRLRVWNWALRNAATGSRQARDPGTKAELACQAADNRYYLLNLPLRRGLTPLRLAPEYEEMLVEVMARRRNDEFWRFNDVIGRAAEHKDIPILMIGGWYDLFSSSTTETYRALRDTIRGPVHLIMGPWTHGMQRRSNGQVDFGPAAAVDMRPIRRAWYDRQLKGLETGSGANTLFPTPVRMFVMGTGDGHKTPDGKLFHGGDWRDAADYPPPGTAPTRYYLHDRGGLGPAPPAAENSSSTFEFDPKNPVPTVGGCTLAARGITTDGAWNQWGGDHTPTWPMRIPLSARNDVVMFRTAPLTRDTEIIGPVTVTLWASSSAVDTDFTAKLIDVYPSTADFPAGFDLILGDGILRARYRESDRSEKMLTPGEICEFHIQLDPCCNVFKKGHRIRVDISSSNFPRFDLNPNTGEPPNDFRTTITAVNTIRHDRVHPSHILLPIQPGNEPNRPSP